MRLPNGYGSVYKLSGRRRNPWVARKTIGWKTDPDSMKAFPIYEFIGYYPKREDALTALVNYNKDPYDLRAATITFEELYERWSEKKHILKDDEHPHGVSEDTIRGDRAAYKVCEPLYKMKFVDIRFDDLQEVLDESGKNRPTLKKVKSLLSQIYDFAVIREIISKERDMTEYLDIEKAGNPDAIDRAPFTKKELEKVWKWESANEYISIILMLIYSGVRISELLDLKKTDVHLDDRWFSIEASKTKAGIRIVPIADKTFKFFEIWMKKNNCAYLLSTPEGAHFDYSNYYDCYWKPLIKEMGMAHRPHDTRHTCVSLLTAAGVDERIIKKIVGHKGQGITQQVYTHLEIGELLDAINKM